MTRLSLFDSGMQPKSVDYASTEAAIQALQTGLHPNYTDALLVTGGRTTHVACRELGQTSWTVKACP